MMTSNNNKVLSEYWIESKALILYTQDKLLSLVHMGIPPASYQEYLNSYLETFYI